MEFIQENYIWFIVGGIILLMALVGFVAEKTDFGRKQFEKKVKVEKQPKVKKEKTSKKEMIIEKESNNVNNLSETVVADGESLAINENLNSDELLFSDNSIAEDLTVPLSGESVAENNSEDEVLDSFAEDLTVPLSGYDKEEPIIEEQTNEIENNLNFAQNENSIINDEIVEEVITEEPFKEIDTTEAVFNNQDEIKLPEIDSLKKEEAEEEDVWKF